MFIDHSENLISFSKFSSISALSKEFRIDSAVNIEKRSAAQMHTGEVEIIRIPIEQFADYLDKAESNTAFGYGLPPANKARIVVNGKQDPANNVISRTKEYFSYKPVPGVLMLDHDPSPYGPNVSPDEMIAILEKIHPDIKDAYILVRGSISSGVHKHHEEPAQKPSSYHIYLFVKDSTDIPRYGEALYKNLWLEGYGFIALSARGDLLERSIIDKCVFSPERLDFVGKPVIKDSQLRYKTPEIRIAKGGLLDTKTLLDLTESKFSKLIKTAGQEAQPLAAKKRLEWENLQIETRVANGEDRASADQQVKSLSLGQHIDLDDGFILFLDNKRKVTIGEVKLDPDKYANKNFYDPIEGLNYHVCAKLFKNVDSRTGEIKLVIHSFAHGSVNRFYLSGIGPNDFDRFEDDQPNHLPNDAPDWQTEYDAQVDKFNERHASVTIGGKHRIRRSPHDTVADICRIRCELFTVTDLRSLHSHELLQTGVKFQKNSGQTPIIQNIVDAWLKHPNCKRYVDGFVFAPNMETQITIFNTWEGFAVEPVEGCKHIPINEHIDQVVCNGDKNLTEYVLNWIAFTYQHPDRPARVALVLRGKKGCGKGTLGHFLMNSWGVHGVHISNSKHLVGNFNGHLADKCFLFADEAFYSGNRADEPILKSLITEPTMMVERKGIDAQQERNYLKVFMATNSEYAVPASKDERRYCVLDVSGEYIGDKSYFDRLYKTCNDKEAQSNFLYEMLNRDISTFNIGDIPETSALKEQRLHSFDSVQKFVHYYLCQGMGEPSYGWGWVPSSSLFETYLTYCKDHRISEHKFQTQTQLSTYLGKVFTAKQKGSGRQRGFEFGSLEEARNAFCEYEKVEIDWGVEQADLEDTDEEDDYI